MNPLIQLKKAVPVFLVALVSFGLLPTMPAVSPPPDGGYPGFNTAEGQNALFSFTTGVGNAAVGWYSLFSNTDGSFNTGVGAGTLLFNIGDQTTGEGIENTAVGTAALLSNTIGFQNTANGAFALQSNMTGDHNTANGASALSRNTTGNGNTATGFDALRDNTTGSNITATGLNALFSNTTGNLNTATGVGALVFNTTGSLNTALGIDAGSNVTTASNVICIGADGQNVSNSCYIGQVFGATSSGGIAVFINSNGRLGTATSSRRFKEEIKPMAQSSEALFALKPVRFRYKKDIDPAGTEQLGLVAEDVERVNPNLVVRDKKGKPYSVRYDQVNAMLLNEFLKEHRKVEQLTKDFESKLAEQQKQIQQLTAGLQKVSAQLELNKTAPQTVQNNQ